MSGLSCWGSGLWKAAVGLLKCCCCLTLRLLAQLFWRLSHSAQSGLLSPATTLQAG